jgi:hypothetical protein
MVLRLTLLVPGSSFPTYTYKAQAVQAPVVIWNEMSHALLYSESVLAHTEGVSARRDSWIHPKVIC